MKTKKNDTLDDFAEVLEVDYNLNKKTVEDNVRVVKKYIEFHEELIPQPAQKKARKWKKYWKDKNCSNSHKNSQLRGVEKYYAYHDIDFTYKKKFQTKDTQPPVISDDQYRNMLYKGAKSVRDTALIYVLSSSGIRATELESVNWGDVDWGKRKFEGIPLKGGDKGGYRFSQSAKESLKEYAKTRHNTNADDPLFTSKTDPSSRLTRHGIYQAVIRIADRAGVKKSDPNVCPHGFRGHFITKMAEEGVNLEKIRQMVNHNSIEMTAKYVDKTKEGKEKSIHSSVFD